MLKKRLVMLILLILPTLVSLAYADADQQASPSPPQVENLTPVSGSNGPEYVDPTGKLGIVQFGDGYTGQIISREQFIAQSHQIENQYAAGANRILGEAHQYMTTASEGADKEITQGVIKGIEQSKRDVSNQHAEMIKQAESLKPRQNYEKPKVLVSE